MFAKLIFVAVVAALAGCGGSASTEQPAPRQEPPRPTVFDPLTSTIGRAESVQDTVDAQAAEQRKRIEDAER